MQFLSHLDIPQDQLRKMGHFSFHIIDVSPKDYLVSSYHNKDDKEQNMLMNVRHVVRFDVNILSNLRFLCFSNLFCSTEILLTRLVRW